MTLNQEETSPSNDKRYNKPACDLRRYDNINIAEVMCKLVNEQSAPQIVMDVFGGNRFEIRYFIAVFEETVKNKIEDPYGKLTQLIKYASGEIQDMFKKFTELPPKERIWNWKSDDAPVASRSTKVIDAYHKEIKECPEIRPRNAEAYRKFHNFLLKCESIYTDGDVLNTPEIMRMLLATLLGEKRDMWSRRVLLIGRKQGKGPDLADFIDLINDENRIINNPVFSKAAVEQYIDKKTKSRRVATYVHISG